MNTLKRKEVTINKIGRKLHDYDYEVMFGNDDESAEKTERFDKNSLSEDDLDRIKAIH